MCRLYGTPVPARLSIPKANPAHELGSLLWACECWLIYDLLSTDVTADAGELEAQLPYGLGEFCSGVL